MTQLWRNQRPLVGEFAPYYAGYIDDVPLGDVLTTLETQLADTLALLRGLPDAKGEHRYAQGKWTVKEVLGHVMDCERVFAYRLLRIARGDTTPLPGFEQDDYVQRGSFAARSLADLCVEFEHLRRSDIALFASLDDTAMARRGTANNQEVSARALVYIVAGHERHHVKVLRAKYL